MTDWQVGERGILTKNDRKGYSSDIHWDLNDMKSELEEDKEESVLDKLSTQSKASDKEGESRREET